MCVNRFFELCSNMCIAWQCMRICTWTHAYNTTKIRPYFNFEMNDVMDIDHQDYGRECHVICFNWHKHINSCLSFVMACAFLDSTGGIYTRADNLETRIFLWWLHNQVEWDWRQLRLPVRDKWAGKGIHKIYRETDKQWLSFMPGNHFNSLWFICLTWWWKSRNMPDYRKNEVSKQLNTAKNDPE